MIENHEWLRDMTFDGRLLAGIGVLSAVIDSGSFTRAGDALGLTSSGVSRAIARLEARVGIRLLERTTRALRLTDEGARFYAQVSPLLDGIADAARVATGAAESVGGRLRVNIDPIFSQRVLAPRLPEFQARYPALTIELLGRDSLGDLLAEGIDVALRFGERPPANLITRRLLETRVLTVASPRYLKKHGRPKTPADLLQHNCLQYRDPLSGRPFDWEFRCGRKVVPIATRGPLLLSDPGTLVEACLAGAGIAQVLALSVTPLIANGKLVDLFPDWPDEVFPLNAFYLSRRHPPAKVRAFLDFCREIIGRHML